ncbi:MAG: glycosyltransferase, partial [Hymenobacteraceae bacterium]|nr:glycosyltransferase [Hymenobacteraceae bacterium]MDX5395683.1 glycosyltransferase [Hymenobacteraceae bacterium]MDX5511737.1 glycosyltransferase [Hymenobacteraceae bacterium]
MMFSLSFLAVYLFLFLVLLLLWLFNRKKNRLQPVTQPRISILIAARNEEANIQRCLEAIQRLHYPTHLIEVLIGDDASTDRTCQLVNDYISDKQHYKCFTIS